MPVYRNHRVAHIHIPKTAGTAIERQFAELGDMQWDSSSWFGRIRRPDRWYEDQHLTLCELRQLSLGNVRGLHVFAVVRNPYQRLTRPEDVAGAIVLLTRPEAAWITGNTLRVDGGESIAG